MLEQTHAVETPEHVQLSYTIAGLGSRLFAGLIDLAVIFASFIGLTLLLAVLGGVSAGIGLSVPRMDIAGSWALAIILLAQFAVMWGYYVLFEGLADGRTIGKRLLRLRVVHDDGLSISFAASAVRNIFRLVDLQPGVLAGVGIVSIILTERGKRIGDIVAGTIVVRERPIRVAAVSVPAEEVAGEPALAAAEFDVLRRYIERRPSLAREHRSRLTDLVAERLRAHLADSGTTDEQALDELYEREAALRSRGAAVRSDRGAAREHHALILQGRKRWAEFAALVERAQRRGLASLSEEEVTEFAARYRELTADLARLRTAARGQLLEELLYVGRLAAAGHNLLYRGRRVTLDRALVFLAADAPREVRRSIRWVAAAAALFWIPAIIAYAGVVSQPAVAHEFLPRVIIDRAETAAGDVDAPYVEIPELYRPLVATSIIANNIQVSFGAFAFGITLGAGTVFILLLNGLVLGGVAGLFAARGVGATLLSFVAPHGVLELTAIAIAGGAGLLIGGALLFGGPGGRRATLTRNARRAITMMAAVIVLLVAAGLIEGLVSPQVDRPLSWKLAVAGATAVALAFYLGFGGRGMRRPSERAASLDLEVAVDDGGGDPGSRYVHHGDARAAHPQ